MQEAICEGHQQKDHHGGKHLRLWHSTSSWKALLEETCTSYRLPRPVRAAVSHILVRKDKWGSPIPKQPEDPTPKITSAASVTRPNAPDLLGCGER